MKKAKFSIILTAVFCLLCVFFTACGQTDISTPSTGNNEPAQSTETPSGSNEGAEDSENSDGNSNHILVVYFSRSGNTENMAKSVANLSCGTLFEIEPSIPYSTNYQETVNRHRQELANNARPEIAYRVDNWDSYNIVFVGFPLWSGNAPMIIHTFMESYDFSDKKVVPFGTSGGSSGSVAYRNLSNDYPDIQFLSGLNLTGSQISSPDGPVRNWLGGLNLLK